MRLLKRSVSQATIIGFLLAFTVGCLPESPITQVSESGASFFAGATSASSRGDSSLIQWNRTSDVPVSEFRVYLVLSDGTLKLLQKVSATTDKYVHSGLTPGQVYRYVVRAVNLGGAEDTNLKIVGTVNYPGLLSASIEDDVPTVSLSPIEGDIEVVRIYAQYPGGQKTLVKSVASTTTKTTLTGLRTGVSYSISAQAYNSLVGEDGNIVVRKVQTPSATFTQSNPRFKGFQNALVYGDVPGWSPFDPDGIRVKTREATVQWVPFRLANSATKYRVYRTDAGEVIDFAALNSCSSTTVGTCVLCTADYPVNHCRDITIQKGKTYDYVVTQVLKDVANVEYAEEIPLDYNPMSDELKASLGDYTPYRLQVSTPPDNMVMIPRDGVNFEYCNLLGRTPRPERNMSCRFSGPGGKPTRAGQVGTAAGADQLTLDDGYFDFGYNFMADRFGQACNWSRQCEPGSPDYGTHKCGKCGAGGTDGNCIAISNQQSSGAIPANSVGVVGNVYYAYSTYANSFCWVKVRDSGAGNYWEPAQSFTVNGTYSSLTSAINHMRTTLSDPTFLPSSNSPRDNYAVPFSQSSSSTGNAYCGAQSSEYGTHRLFRLIEARAAMAPPWISGDLNYKSESEIRDIEYNPSGGAYTDLSNAPVLGCGGWGFLGLGSYNTKFSDTGRLAPITNTTFPLLINPVSFLASYISTMTGDTAQNKYKGTIPVPYERPIHRLFPMDNMIGSNFGFFLGAWATSHCSSRYGLEQHLTIPWNTGETIPSLGTANGRFTSNLWDSAGYSGYGPTDAQTTRATIWNNMKTNFRGFDIPTNYTSGLDPSNDSMAGLSFGENRTIFLPSSATVYSTTSYTSSSVGTMTSDAQAITGISGGRDGMVGSILLRPDDPLNVDGLTPHGLPVSKTRTDSLIEYIPSAQIGGQLSPNDLWAVFPIGQHTNQPNVVFTVGNGRRWSTLWTGDAGDSRTLTFRCGAPVRPKK